jgi:hypothetical protein
MRGEVLIDNFTLQGAYCYLFEGCEGGVYKNCLATLLDAVVLYDSVRVPSGVTQTNHAVREITDRLSGVITECNVPDESSNWMGLYYDGVIPSYLTHHSRNP